MDLIGQARRAVPGSVNRGAALFVAAAVCVSAGWLWWICRYQSSIPFLPQHAGAEWIVYPKPPDANPRHTAAVPAVFQRSFFLPTPPTSARLSIRTFKQGRVVINGQPLATLALRETDWKAARIVDVAKSLQAGTNLISVTVTNSFGPPALWLALEADGRGLSSDQTWQVSLAGAAWLSAVLATQPPVIRAGNPLFGRESMSDSLRRTWPMLLVILAFSVGAMAAVHWGQRWSAAQSRRASARRTHRKRGAVQIFLSSLFLSPALKGAPQDGPQPAHNPEDNSTGPAAVLVLILLLWAALFCHNLPRLAPLVGFDRDGHIEYVNYILEKGALPLADAGWQMYQPPLYYVLSAALLGPFELSASSDSGVMVLRVFSALTGIAHLVVLFLGLRLLFPGQASCQIVGLLFAGFLPANLYLAHHPTNEGLAALFVTGSIYFTLRILRSENPSRRWYLAVGVSLGLALLTKFSAVLALPFVFGALAWPGFTLATPAREARPRAAGFALAALGVLAVCGWHYARVWYRFGNPLVGNWDPKLPFAWWQDPGYRTAGWYSHFGQALSTPLFSGLSSFADGLYSSLWGDGLGSGSARIDFRPQWNYDLMNASFLLALFGTLLLIVGAVVWLLRFLRQPAPKDFLLGGLLAAFGFGLVFMTLRVPSYAQVKAFYALPALLPLGALAAMGWEFLAKRSVAGRSGLWVVLLAWALTAYATFWIPSGAPSTYTVRGIGLLDDGRFAEAAEEFSRALKLAPNAPGARAGLADALGRLGRPVEARAQLNLVQQAKPTETETLVQAAVNAGAFGDYAQAAELLRTALAQAPDRATAYQQLAVCLEKLGRDREEIETCRAGLRADPYSPKLHLLLAKAAARIGDSTNATAHLAYALALQPDLPEARELLGR